MSTLTKVYLVNAGADYYPSTDNTKFVTTDWDRACKCAKKLQEKLGKYDWVEIVTKGVDK